MLSQFHDLSVNIMIVNNRDFWFSNQYARQINVFLWPTFVVVLCGFMCLCLWLQAGLDNKLGKGGPNSCRFHCMLDGVTHLIHTDLFFTIYTTKLYAQKQAVLKELFTQRWKFSHYLLTHTYVDGKLSFIVVKTFLELHSKTVLQHSPTQTRILF